MSEIDMMRAKYFLIPILYIFLISPCTVFSWNATGHQIIAKIAYDHLRPSVRDKVDSLVDDMNQQYANMKSFLDLAVWPDLIRRQKIETYTHWHYVDMAFSTDGTPLKNLIDTDNALWAVKKISPIVKNNKANPYERSRFLAFYAHIVGDLHQPLHTVSYMASRFPDGDQGGNAYKVIYRNQKRNLHYVWDSGVGAFDSSHADVEALANQLMTKYPESHFEGRENVLQPEVWVEEGMVNAKEYVYTTPCDGVVSEEYIQAGKVIAEQQVVLAGYRLAKLLNQVIL